MMLKEGENIQDYKQFFDDMPVPMIIYDPIGLEILAVNKTASISYGYSEHEFLSKTLLDIRPEEEQQRYIEKVAEFEQLGYNDAGYWLHKKKNGETFYTHIFSNSTVYKGKKARLSLAYDVNKRMLTERENEALNATVKKQKEQLDDILSSIKEVVWSRRISDGTLTYVNNASIDIFGYTPEEMTQDGGRHLEHVHPDDLEELQEKIKQNYNEGHAEMEYRIFHKDGSVKYVLTQANVKKGEHGERLSYNGITVDITRQHLAENALKKKIEEIENVFECINDGFISIDKEWNIAYVNKHFETLTKNKRSELLGKNFWEQFPRLIDSPYYADYLAAMNDRKICHSKGPSPTTGRILSVYFYPIDAGIAVYFKDITEESNLSDAIENKGKKLNAIINNTKDIIWSVDTNMELLSANDAYYKRVSAMAGDKLFEEINDTDFDEEKVKKWTGFFARVLAGETFRVIEEEVLEGTTIYEEISFNPIYDINNKVAGASCFSRNITDRVEQLLMIQEQNEKLKNIAWIQSHKVRGPVATILGLVELFHVTPTEDNANRQILEGIKSTALQLDAVIREVVNNTMI